ncbi:hypothetical protein VTN31DRAFT_2470 [Thermomyces dupontii]|uniref:uncharacterized protein n=1 Tax=Talaromyces thermophilus TaxID=28565 RepID=UPI003743E085
MGWIRTVALAVLSLSFFTFVALFGRLPIFRKTPIGLIHRAIWIHIPHGLRRIDALLFGGRLLYCWNRTGRYLMRENHPLVLIFFLTLLVTSQVAFVPAAWPRLGALHRVCVPVVVILPYLFLYASVTTKSFITPQNIRTELARYPYDRVLFHPGKQCSTCHLLKPARSKHCSICNACVSRHDHHCIWLTNCVGRENYHYFLSLLLSLSIMLVYGAYLGYILFDDMIKRYLSPKGPHWSRGRSWSSYLHYWTLAVTSDLRLGFVFLLAILTAPLALGFFTYHIYLLWAGATTNETSKWSDWREDVADGLVYKARRSDIYPNPKPRDDTIEPPSSWPGTADQVLILTDEPPRVGFAISTQSNHIMQSEDPNAPIDPRWHRVNDMREVDNIYDLGFWRNMRDALKLPV